MAIITISRKIASLGDETAQELANILSYDFIDRKTLENDLLKMGVSENQLKKYDEKKPDFWASLSKQRDEYYDLLREAVYERAVKGNCIFIGRGGFAILKGVTGTYSVRLIAPDDIRISRLMSEFNYSEKQAQSLMQESDNNRNGFHKCFFNVEHADAVFYHMVLNTGFVSFKEAAQIIKTGVYNTISEKDESDGIKKLCTLKLKQKIINHLSFTHSVQIYFLDASVSDTEIKLFGVTDSGVNIEKGIEAASEIADGKKITSEIKIVTGYKPFP